MISFGSKNDYFDTGNYFWVEKWNISDCDTDTDSQFNMMLPLLLMDDKNSTDSLMLMMMMQTMGNQPFTMEQVKFLKFKNMKISKISQF